MSRKIASGFLFIRSACILVTIYIFQKYMILPSLLRVAIFILLIIGMLISWLKLYKRNTLPKNIISIILSIIFSGGLGLMDYHLYTDLKFIDKMYVDKNYVNVRSRNINTQKSSFNIFITGINLLGYKNHSIDTNIVANIDPIGKKINIKAYPKYESNEKNNYGNMIDASGIQKDIDTIEKEQKIEINYYICFTNKLQLKELLDFKDSITKIKGLEKIELIKEFLKDRMVTNMPTAKIVGVFNANLFNIFSAWKIETKVII